MVRMRGQFYSHATLTVVSLECLCSLLLVAKDKVNPEMKPLGDMFTFQSLTTLTHKVTRVYQTRKEDNSTTTHSQL